MQTDHDNFSGDPGKPGKHAGLNAAAGGGQVSAGNGLLYFVPDV
jgi:hypothetical protein